MRDDERHEVPNPLNPRMDGGERRGPWAVSVATLYRSTFFRAPMACLVLLGGCGAQQPRPTGGHVDRTATHETVSTPAHLDLAPLPTTSGDPLVGIELPDIPEPNREPPPPLPAHEREELPARIVRVTSSPSGAEVSLGTRILGHTRLVIRVPAGDHWVLRIRRPGFTPRIQSAPADRGVMRVTLIEAPADVTVPVRRPLIERTECPLPDPEHRTHGDGR
ncbi:MAG: PEGA domain-containing protein [Spirochaetota bacterium]